MNVSWRELFHVFLDGSDKRYAVVVRIVTPQSSTDRFERPGVLPIFNVKAAIMFGNFCWTRLEIFAGLDMVVPYCLLLRSSVNRRFWYIS